VAKVRGRLAVSKQTTKTFNIDIFNVKKLYDVQSKEKYWVKIKNRFISWGNFNQ
jgi:hypothetical protein